LRGTKKDEKMAGTRVISYKEALEIVKNKFSYTNIEEAGLEASVGRVLAEDLRAKVSVPPFDISSMDGYALAAVDSASDEEVSHYVWVNTGDRIPEGMERVVKFEDVIEDTVEKKGKLILKHKPRKWENIRKKGEDIAEGELILKKGTMIDSLKIVSLRNCKIERVKVYKRPRVAVIATGDELGNEITPSNDLMLSLFLQQWGCEVKNYPVLKDREEEIRAALENLEGFDLILTTGGTSKGRKDLMRKVVSKIGKIHFHQTRIKPGRTAFFGEIYSGIYSENYSKIYSKVSKVRSKIYSNSKNSKKLTPIFCLPGNPPACLAAFMLYVRPAVLKMTGSEEFTFKATISEIFSPSKSTRFILLSFDGERAIPLKGGFFRSLLAANSYLILEEGREIKKEETAEIHPLINLPSQGA